MLPISVSDFLNLPHALHTILGAEPFGVDDSGTCYFVDFSSTEGRLIVSARLHRCDALPIIPAGSGRDDGQSILGIYSSRELANEGVLSYFSQ